MNEMKKTMEKAYAKLNISLDVTERRPDGFHNMVMVMQTISLSDELEIALNDSGAVSASTNVSYIPSDEQNLAVKAARAYLKAVGESCGAKLVIHKRIPVGAGMAGGSADAAAVLRGMNRLFEDRLSTTELLELAAGVGSDVPFCLVGGTKLAEGRGERMTALEELPACWFAVCKPSFSISTPDLFRQLDKSGMRCHPDTLGMLKAIQEGNLQQICRRMYNVFEDCGDRRLRTVSQIKSRLLDCGAHGAIMTGTGSAVFGIFTDQEKAERAAGALKKEYSFACVAEPVSSLLPEDKQGSLAER